MKNRRYLLDISWETILKIAIAGLTFYLLYLIRDILIWFLFALIISVLFDPAINFLQKRKIPRILAVTLVYTSVFGFLVLLISLTIPTFISEISHFSQLFPRYFERISPPLRALGFEAFENLEAFLTVLENNLQQMAANIFSILFTVFGGIFSTFFVITIAAFLSLEERSIEKALSLLFPKKYEAYALSLWKDCQKKVSGWFGARILGCIFIGFLSYFAFLLFNVKYPAILALLAGALEFIPILGPLATAILAFLIVFLESFKKAIFVLVFFIVLQQVEGNVLTPILAKKFIELPPALVLVSLAIGGTLFGFWGAVLFVPLAGIIFEFTRDFLKKRKEEETTTL